MGKERVSNLSIERITKIVRLARRNRSVSMAMLKTTLEVSEPSIRRDITFLRNRLGCPLEWDRAKKGYVIRDDLAEGGRFELPGFWFDSSEIFSLLTMLQLVEGVQPGLLSEYVAPLRSRLREMLSKGANRRIQRAY